MQNRNETMDFNVLLEDLRVAAENLINHSSNRKSLSAIYCHKVSKAVDKVSSWHPDYDNVITGLWVITAHFTDCFNHLIPVPNLKEAASRLFRECAKTVLNIQWQNLEEDNDLRQRFVVSLTNLNAKLATQNDNRFRLLSTLLENPWTDPTLAKIMGGEAEDDEEKEEVRTYIEGEDAIILQLRVDMMLQENCEEYALNLCNSCLLHPDLKRDMKLRKTQLSLLYKLGHRDKLQEECQKLSIQEAVSIIRQLQTRATKEICTILAQTFMVQHWIRQSDQKANKELLKLWIRQQALADKDQDRFKESVWAIAKLSQSTEQIIYFIDILREQCGKTYLQLYMDMCIFAINVDKGQMETSLKEGKDDMVKARKEDMAAICGKLACLTHHASIKVARICALTAFALKTSTETYQSVVKFYGSEKERNCCGFCNKNNNDFDHGTVNPATLYEVERLLNMLRPEYLNPDSPLSNIKSLCERFCKESNLNIKLEICNAGPQNAQLNVMQTGKGKSMPVKSSNVFEAVPSPNITSAQALLRHKLQTIQSQRAVQPSLSTFQQSRPNILQSGTKPNTAASIGQFKLGVRTSQPPQTISSKSNIRQQQPYLTSSSSSASKPGSHHVSSSSHLTTSSTDQRGHVTAQKKNPTKLNPQLIQYIQSAVRQNSNVLQELLQHPDKDIVRTVLNMMGQGGKQAIPSRQSVAVSVSDQQRLPTVSTLLRPPSSKPHLPEGRFIQPSSQPTGSYPSFSSSLSITNNQSTKPFRFQQASQSNQSGTISQYDARRAESLRLAKAQAGNLRSVVQSSMLTQSHQKQQIMSKQMAGSTITVNQPSSSYPFIDQWNIGSKEKLMIRASHPQSRPTQVLQKSTKSSNDHFTLSNNRYLSISKTQGQQSTNIHDSTPNNPLHAQSDLTRTQQSNVQKQSALSSDELSGSIIGIDDTIITELLQDSGIFSNTFPDIEEDLNVDDLNKGRDGRGTSSSSNIQIVGQPKVLDNRSAFSSLHQMTMSSSVNTNIPENRLSGINIKNDMSSITVGRGYNRLSAFPSGAVPSLTLSSSSKSHIDSNLLNQRQFPIEVSKPYNSAYPQKNMAINPQQMSVEQIREMMKQEDIELEITLDSSNNATYRCIICSLAFKVLEELREHVRNVCKPGLQSSSVYNTKIKQDKVNSAKAGLETNTVFQCLRCFELCISDVGIKQHRLTCKRVPTVPSDIKNATQKNKTPPSSRPSTPKASPSQSKSDWDTTSNANKIPELPLPFPYPSLNKQEVLNSRQQSVTDSMSKQINTSTKTSNSGTSSPAVIVNAANIDCKSTANVKREPTPSPVRSEADVVKMEANPVILKIEEDTNVKQKPDNLLPVNYSEISGSGGSKFYRCKNCNQTLCSYESLLRHWKVCATKPPVVCYKTQYQFPLEQDEELEPGEIRPLVGQALQNVLEIIAAVARGDIGESPKLEDIDLDTDDEGSLLSLETPEDQPKKPMGKISKKEFPPQSMSNHIITDFNKNSAPGKISCLEMKQDTSIKDKKVKGDIDCMGSVTAMTAKAYSNVGHEESGISDNDAQSNFSIDGNVMEVNRDAPPMLRDRTRLKPIQSFINESFVSPYAKSGANKKPPPATDNGKLKDDKSERDGESEIGDFKCTVCGKNNQSKRILIQHYAGRHLQPYTMKTLTDGSSYFCHLCQKTFSTFMHYMQHVPNHGNTIMKKMAQYSGSLRSQQHWSSRIAASRGFTNANKAKKGGISPKRAKALQSKRKAANTAREKLKRFLTQLNSSSAPSFSLKGATITRKERKPVRISKIVKQSLKEKVLRRTLRNKHERFSKTSISENEDSCPSSSPYVSDVTDDDEYAASEDSDSDSTVKEPPQTRNRTRAATKTDTKNVNENVKLTRCLVKHPELTDASNFLPCVSVHRLTRNEVAKFTKSKESHKNKTLLCSEPKDVEKDIETSVSVQVGVNEDSTKELSKSSHSQPSITESPSAVNHMLDFQSSFETYIKGMSKEKPRKVRTRSRSLSGKKGRIHEDESDSKPSQDIVQTPESVCCETHDVPAQLDNENNTDNHLHNSSSSVEEEIISSARNVRCSVNLGQKVNIQTLKTLEGKEMSHNDNCKSSVLPIKNDFHLNKEVLSTLPLCAVVLERDKFVEKKVSNSGTFVIGSADGTEKQSITGESSCPRSKRLGSDFDKTVMNSASLHVTEKSENAPIGEQKKPSNISSCTESKYESVKNDQKDFEEKKDTKLVMVKEETEVKISSCVSVTVTASCLDKSEGFISMIKENEKMKRLEMDKKDVKKVVLKHLEDKSGVNIFLYNEEVKDLPKTDSTTELLPFEINSVADSSKGDDTLVSEEKPSVPVSLEPTLSDVYEQTDNSESEKKREEWPSIPNKNINSRGNEDDIIPEITMNSIESALIQMKNASPVKCHPDEAITDTEESTGVKISSENENISPKKVGMNHWEEECVNIDDKRNATYDQEQMEVSESVNESPNPVENDLLKGQNVEDFNNGEKDNYENQGSVCGVENKMDTFDKIQEMKNFNNRETDSDKKFNSVQNVGSETVSDKMQEMKGDMNREIDQDESFDNIKNTETDSDNSSSRVCGDIDFTAVTPEMKDSNNRETGSNESQVDICNVENDVDVSNEMQVVKNLKNKGTNGLKSSGRGCDVGNEIFVSGKTQDAKETDNNRSLDNICGVENEVISHKTQEVNDFLKETSSDAGFANICVVGNEIDVDAAQEWKDLNIREIYVADKTQEVNDFNKRETDSYKSLSDVCHVGIEIVVSDEMHENYKLIDKETISDQRKIEDNEADVNHMVREKGSCTSHCNDRVDCDQRNVTLKDDVTDIRKMDCFQTETLCSGAENQPITKLDLEADIDEHHNTDGKTIDISVSMSSLQEIPLEGSISVDGQDSLINEEKTNTESLKTANELSGLKTTDGDNKNNKECDMKALNITAETVSSKENDTYLETNSLGIDLMKFSNKNDCENDFHIDIDSSIEQTSEKQNESRAPGEASNVNYEDRIDESNVKGTELNLVDNEKKDNSENGDRFSDNRTGLLGLEDQEVDDVIPVQDEVLSLPPNYVQDCGNQEESVNQLEETSGCTQDKVDEKILSNVIYGPLIQDNDFLQKDGSGVISMEPNSIDNSENTENVNVDNVDISDKLLNIGKSESDANSLEVETGEVNLDNSMLGTNLQNKEEKNNSLLIAGGEKSDSVSQMDEKVYSSRTETVIDSHKSEYVNVSDKNDGVSNESERYEIISSEFEEDGNNDTILSLTDPSELSKITSSNQTTAAEDCIAIICNQDSNLEKRDSAKHEYECEKELRRDYMDERSDVCNGPNQQQEIFQMAVVCVEKRNVEMNEGDEFYEDANKTCLSNVSGSDLVHDNKYKEGGMHIVHTNIALKKTLSFVEDGPQDSEGYEKSEDKIYGSENFVKDNERNTLDEKLVMEVEGQDDKTAACEVADDEAANEMEALNIEGSSISKEFDAPQEITLCSGKGKEVEMKKPKDDQLEEASGNWGDHILFGNDQTGKLVKETGVENLEEYKNVCKDTEINKNKETKLDDDDSIDSKVARNKEEGSEEIVFHKANNMDKTGTHNCEVKNLVGQKESLTECCESDVDIILFEMNNETDALQSSTYGEKLHNIISGTMNYKHGSESNSEILVDDVNISENNKIAVDFGTRDLHQINEGSNDGEDSQISGKDSPLEKEDFSETVAEVLDESNESVTTDNGNESEKRETNRFDLQNQDNDEDANINEALNKAFSCNVSNNPNESLDNMIARSLKKNHTSCSKETLRAHSCDNSQIGDDNKSQDNCNDVIKKVEMDNCDIDDKGVLRTVDQGEVESEEEKLVVCTEKDKNSNIDDVINRDMSLHEKQGDLNETNRQANEGKSCEDNTVEDGQKIEMNIAVRDIVEDGKNMMDKVVEDYKIENDLSGRDAEKSEETGENRVEMERDKEEDDNGMIGSNSDGVSLTDQDLDQKSEHQVCIESGGNVSTDISVMNVLMGEKEGSHQEEKGEVLASNEENKETLDSIEQLGCVESLDDVRKPVTERHRSSFARRSQEPRKTGIDKPNPCDWQKSKRLKSKLTVTDKEEKTLLEREAKNKFEEAKHTSGSKETPIIQTRGRTHSICDNSQSPNGKKSQSDCNDVKKVGLDNCNVNDKYVLRAADRGEVECEEEKLVDLCTEKDKTSHIDYVYYYDGNNLLDKEQDDINETNVEANVNKPRDKEDKLVEDCEKAEMNVAARVVDVVEDGKNMMGKVVQNDKLEYELSSRDVEEHEESRRNRVEIERDKEEDVKIMIGSNSDGVCLTEQNSNQKSEHRVCIESGGNVSTDRSVITFSLRQKGDRLQDDNGEILASNEENKDLDLTEQLGSVESIDNVSKTTTKTHRASSARRSQKRAKNEKEKSKLCVSQKSKRIKGNLTVAEKEEKAMLEGKAEDKRKQTKCTISSKQIPIIHRTRGRAHASYDNSLTPDDYKSQDDCTIVKKIGVEKCDANDVILRTEDQGEVVSEEEKKLFDVCTEKDKIFNIDYVYDNDGDKSLDEKQDDINEANTEANESKPRNCVDNLGEEVEIHVAARVVDVVEDGKNMAEKVVEDGKLENKLSGRDVEESEETWGVMIERDKEKEGKRLIGLNSDAVCLTEQDSSQKSEHGVCIESGSNANTDRSVIRLSLGQKGGSHQDEKRILASNEDNKEALNPTEQLCSVETMDDRKTMTKRHRPSSSTRRSQKQKKSENDRPNPCVRQKSKRIKGNLTVAGNEEKAMLGGESEDSCSKKTPIIHRTRGRMHSSCDNSQTPDDNKPQDICNDVKNKGVDNSDANDECVLRTVDRGEVGNEEKLVGVCTEKDKKANIDDVYDGGKSLNKQDDIIETNAQIMKSKPSDCEDDLVDDGDGIEMNVAARIANVVEDEKDMMDQVVQDDKRENEISVRDVVESEESGGNRVEFERDNVKRNKRVMGSNSDGVCLSEHRVGIELKGNESTDSPVVNFSLGQKGGSHQEMKGDILAANEENKEAVDPIEQLDSVESMDDRKTTKGHRSSSSTRRSQKQKKTEHDRPKPFVRQKPKRMKGKLTDAEKEEKAMLDGETEDKCEDTKHSSSSTRTPIKRRTRGRMHSCCDNSHSPDDNRLQDDCNDVVKKVGVDNSDTNDEFVLKTVENVEEKKLVDVCTEKDKTSNIDYVYDYDGVKSLDEKLDDINETNANESKPRNYKDNLVEDGEEVEFHVAARVVNVIEGGKNMVGTVVQDWKLENELSGRDVEESEESRTRVEIERDNEEDVKKLIGSNSDAICLIEQDSSQKSDYGIYIESVGYVNTDSSLIKLSKGGSHQDEKREILASNEENKEALDPTEQLRSVGSMDDFLKTMTKTHRASSSTRRSQKQKKSENDKPNPCVRQKSKRITAKLMVAEKEETAMLGGEAEDKSKETRRSSGSKKTLIIHRTRGGTNSSCDNSHSPDDNSHSPDDNKSQDGCNDVQKIGVDNRDANYECDLKAVDQGDVDSEEEKKLVVCTEINKKSNIDDVYDGDELRNEKQDDTNETHALVIESKSSELVEDCERVYINAAAGTFDDEKNMVDKVKQDDKLEKELSGRDVEQSKKSGGNRVQLGIGKEEDGKRVMGSNSDGIWLTEQDSSQKSEHGVCNEFGGNASIGSSVKNLLEEDSDGGCDEQCSVPLTDEILKGQKGGSQDEKGEEILLSNEENNETTEQPRNFDFTNDIWNTVIKKRKASSSPIRSQKRKKTESDKPYPFARQMSERIKGKFTVAEKEENEVFKRKTEDMCEETKEECQSQAPENDAQSLGSDEDDLSDYNLVIEEDKTFSVGHLGPFETHIKSKFDSQLASSEKDAVDDEYTICDENEEKVNDKKKQTTEEVVDKDLNSTSIVNDSDNSSSQGKPDAKRKGTIPENLSGLERKQKAFREKTDSVPFTWDLEEQESQNIAKKTSIVSQLKVQQRIIERNTLPRPLLSKPQETQTMQKPKSNRVSKRAREASLELSQSVIPLKKMKNKKSPSLPKSKQKSLPSPVPQTPKESKMSSMSTQVTPSPPRKRRRPKWKDTSTDDSSTIDNKNVTSPKTTSNIGDKSNIPPSKTVNTSNSKKDVNTTSTKLKNNPAKSCQSDSDGSPCFIAMDDDISFKVKSFSPSFTPETKEVENKKSTSDQPKKRGRPRKRALLLPDTKNEVIPSPKDTLVPDVQSSKKPEPFDPKLKKAGLIPVAKTPTLVSPVTITDGKTPTTCDKAMKILNVKKNLKLISSSPLSSVKFNKDSKMFKASSSSPSTSSVVSDLSSPVEKLSKDSINLVAESPVKKPSDLRDAKVALETTVAVVKRRKPTPTRKYFDFQRSNKQNQKSTTSKTTVYKVEPLPTPPVKSVPGDHTESNRTLHTPLPSGVTHVKSSVKKTSSNMKWKIDKEMKSSKVKAKQNRAPISFKRT